MSRPSASIPSRELLRRLTPRSIAIVGAKSGKRHFLGSGAVMQALERVGFEGDLHMVNRSGAEAFGRPAFRTCAEIGQPIDLAAMCVPAAAVVELLPDLARAGIKTATILAGGFAEAGAEGQRLQAELEAKARAYGITLIGPNCLGFMNVVDRTGAWYSGFPADLRPGAVAIVSQSGGLGDAMLEFAHAHGIGIGYLVTTGNEPFVSVSDAIAAVIEDPRIRAVAAYCEGIRNTAAFAVTLERARAMKKAVVMVKGGSSPIGARNALSHTGSLVGDDAVVTAVFERLGVVRVTSLEDAVLSAHVIATCGPLSAPGVGVVGLSGGACSVIADKAHAVGLALPDLSPDTKEQLARIVPDYATPNNPMDVTGGADEQAFERTIQTIAAQDDIGMLLVSCNVPTHLSGATENVADRLSSIGRGVKTVAKPVILASQTFGHMHEFAQRIVGECGIDVAVPGIDKAIVAAERLAWWSMQLGRPAHRVTGSSTAAHDTGLTAVSEWTATRLLSAHGVPFPPISLARNEAEVRAAVAAGKGPCVLKICSPDIQHKTEIGGVALNVTGEDHAVQVYRALIATARNHAPRAAIDGVLVAPMRGKATEMIVGVSRDPQWGLMLLVGLGGVWVEVFRDTVIRPLPVTRADIGDMLRSLKGAALLAGVRGEASIAWDALLDAILAVAGAAERFGEQLESLEINPLRVDAIAAEALDALIVLRGVPQATARRDEARVA